jgi:hypothetical protein
MYASQQLDLDQLLNRYVPKDPDRAVNAHVLEEWSKAMADADRVTVEWVNRYGPKLRAAWFNPEGQLLVSTARPPSRAGSVRSFVHAWESYMQRRGRQPTVEWGEQTES